MCASAASTRRELSSAQLLHVQEDAQLVQLVAAFGTERWPEIAKVSFSHCIHLSTSVQGQWLAQRQIA